VTRRLVILGLWLFGLFAAVAYYVPLFRLQRVLVEGQAAGQEEQITALLGAETGANLMRLDLAQWAERIAALPAIESARTYVTLAGSAVASVEATRPVCLVDTRPVAGVSAEGLILPLQAHRPAGRVPLITGVGGTPEDYSRSQNARLRCALAFLALWQELAPGWAPDLAEIQVTPDQEVKIYLWPDRLVVNLGRGEWNDRLATLWPVLKRLPVSHRTLDLRFAGRVVEST
jgi:hypothetical protein